MNKFITEIEITLIESVRETLLEDECPIEAKVYLDFLNAALAGQYELVLNHPLSQRILKVEVNDESGANAVNKQLEENVERFLSDVSEDEAHIRQLVVLIVAVSNLQLFIQNNWVGPPTKFNPVSLLGPNPSALQESCLTDFAFNYLSVDGESIYPLSTGSLFLAFARILLMDCGSFLTDCKTTKLWLMRCLHTQQDLLEERSPSLKSIISEIIADLNGCYLFESNAEYRELTIQFHLEAGHLFYFYYEDAKAHGHFDLARTMSGLTVRLKGALGKRTRFQEKNISQLVLQVERSEELRSENDQRKTQVDLTTLPKNVALDDEAVLEQIQFVEPESVSAVAITALDQAMILGLCRHHRRSHEGQGSIVQEESMAYINCVLSQPCNWSIQTKALLMRALWETESSRLIQRSLSQLEELVSQFSRTDVDCFVRLRLVYAVSLPPKWVTERHLGDLLMNINATASAAEVYLRLQLWEDVIKCYVILGHENDAKQLIREQIAIKETPSLWCYLGDVTHDPEDYLKAWDLSEGRSSRAQRSLGYLYVRNHELEKSLPYFEKSLEINPLQIGVWFTYGCTCLSNGHYEKAAKAFQRCVNLNSDNPEAWNNLATAHIRAKNKRRAFLTYQEALKCDFENWRIWENYLLVSADVGEFEATIEAYERLLVLRQKHIDVQVLAILVRVIRENIADASGQPSARLRPKVLQLFNKITSTIVNNPDVWHLFAQLMMAGTKDELSQADVKNTLKYLLNGYRFYTMDGQWDSDIDRCRDVCQQFVKLTAEYEECLGMLEDETQKAQMATSARFTIKSLIMRIEKNYLDPVMNKLPIELEGDVQLLEKSVQKFLEMSK